MVMSQRYYLIYFEKKTQVDYEESFYEHSTLNWLCAALDVTKKCQMLLQSARMTIPVEYVQQPFIMHAAGITSVGWPAWNWWRQTSQPSSDDTQHLFHKQKLHKPLWYSKHTIILFNDAPNKHIDFNRFLKMSVCWHTFEWINRQELKIKRLSLHNISRYQNQK